jgi:aldehyde dehydrogenase (NAD+)
MALHKNYIAGEWDEGVKVAQNINPSDTNDIVGEYASASAEDVDRAAQAAAAAFRNWSRTSPEKRFDILDAIGTENPCSPRRTRNASGA